MLTFAASMCDVLSRRLRRDDRGATAVEYGLIVVLIAVVIAAVVATLGNTIAQAFTQATAGF